MGPRKGVISQSVKDVVQSLVDDDLVSKDRNFCKLTSKPMMLLPYSAVSMRKLSKIRSGVFFALIY